MMKASYLGAMGYAQRSDFPTTWPILPSYHDPETSVRSYQKGIEQCEEDQTYSVNPAEGRERLLEGMDLVIELFGREVLPQIKAF